MITNGKKKAYISEYTKILVPESRYNYDEDKRLLIPYTDWERIGFMDHEGDVVLEPKFVMYYGDCYCNTDLVMVAVNHTYGFSKSSGNVSTYLRPLYGLINYKGETIIPTEYFSMLRGFDDKEIYTVQNMNYQYGVINKNGNIIIPFGRYSWIDGFDHGLARVNKHVDDKSIKEVWGIINLLGEEILPLEYDEIWNFYGKNINKTRIVKGNNSSLFTI